MSPTQFYTWQGYRCAYDVHTPDNSEDPALLLIHPIGVGLSRRFWDRFCHTWRQHSQPHPLYVPDLLGCGESAMPHRAYRPDDWAAQLQTLITSVIQRPVVLVIQGALFPVGIRLVQRMDTATVCGLVLAGPPGWNLISQSAKPLQQRLLWNGLFSNPLGNAFYRYARREAFLDSFSRRQLFADPADIDQEWLNMLTAGAADPDSRFAVFSFLAGFWRQDYTAAIEAIQQPTLVLFGKQASGIDQASKNQPPQERLNSYLEHLPHPQGKLIPGRNVLPYESTEAFVDCTSQWLEQTFSAAARQN